MDARPADVTTTTPACHSLALILSAVFALVLLAAVAPIVRADPLDDQTRQIAKRLQCPVCEGTSVADSPSELAGQMRAVIRRKLEQGESEQAIIAYFVERYGDAVLVEPPRRGLGLAVWFGPVLMLAAGTAVLAMLIRSWLRPRLAATPTVSHREERRNGTVEQPAAPPCRTSYADRARQELEGFRKEI